LEMVLEADNLHAKYCLFSLDQEVLAYCPLKVR
jgi:hypothetical protein